MTVLEEAIEDPKEVVETDATIESTNNETQQIDEKERNWRAFLDKRKEEQRQLEEERKKNHELEIERSRRNKEIEDLKIAFQALAEKKDSSDSYDSDEPDQKKFIENEVNRILFDRDEAKKKLDEQSRQAKETIEIKDQMPDLLEVCSHDNLAYLEYYHPEIAIPLAAMPNGLQKTKLAYQAVKKHVKMATKEKEKIEKNLAKPKSLHSSISNETQGEESSGVMSDKKQKDTWAKMQRLMSGQDED